jgi:hypothetical protein
MDIVKQLQGAHWTDASGRLRLIPLAIDEIKRLRKANKRLGEIATDAVGWLPPASVNGPREEYQHEIKELTDGHC